MTKIKDLDMKQRKTVKLAALALIGVFIVGFFISARFAAERYEETVIARDQSMQNVWSMTQQAMEMEGFTTKDFSQTFIDGIKAQANRYENDTGGMMKWVKEAASQLTPEVHVAFMKSLDKIFTKKEMSQKNKISSSQDYKTWLKTTIKGSAAKYILRYPSKEANTIMSRVIVTKKTKETWETGIEEVSNPFGNQVK